jgi:hypothetical protein
MLFYNYYHYFYYYLMMITATTTYCRLHSMLLFFHDPHRKSDDKFEEVRNLSKLQQLLPHVSDDWHVTRGLTFVEFDWIGARRMNGN